MPLWDLAEKLPRVWRHQSMLRRANTIRDSFLIWKLSSQYIPAFSIIPLAARMKFHHRPDAAVHFAKMIVADPASSLVWCPRARGRKRCAFCGS